jgi:predicted AlkP superfamily pyrophosphatase or phosphodiesterase
MSRFIFIVLGLALLLVSNAAPTEPARPHHVVVIGVDGLSPNGIRTAQTPHIDALMARGAYTLHARAVMPTSSSPNWASMIMGAGPEQHGVTSNEWQPDQFAIAPTVRGPRGIFPTIFSVLRQQRPESHIAILHHWKDFARLVETDTVDWIANPATEVITTQRAVEYVLEHKPTLLFVHLDHVDHAGHEHGWTSPEYLAAVTVADDCIGKILQAVAEAGIADETIILVTSDHGGRGKNHGGATMDEIEIPWIIAGPGVTPGREITAPVDTFQTAATIAYVFGLTPPEAWIATPVLAAFESPSTAPKP